MILLSTILYKSTCFLAIQLQDQGDLVQEFYQSQYRVAIVSFESWSTEILYLNNIKAIGNRPNFWTPHGPLVTWVFEVMKTIMYFKLWVILLVLSTLKID